jgi:F-type H+-transporting ATPase subunit epsilon
VAGKTFTLSVVTPMGAVLDTEATSVVFPAFDGEMGVLPNHAPMLVQMGIGLLKAVTAKGETHELYVDGGFAQMTSNRLTLLTEQARKLDTLSRQEADRLLDEAHQMKAAGDEKSFEERDTAQERARVQRRLSP